MKNTFTLRLKNNVLHVLPRPCLMGVVNMSANSFYKPIKDLDTALTQIAAMVQAGATVIDVGGEATNPKVDIAKEKPTIHEEIDRVVPVVEKIKQCFDVLVSVDTSSAAVMQAAVIAGADMINDQRALMQPDSLETVAALNVPVCLMHNFENLREAGASSEQTLLLQIKNDLIAAVKRCEQAGIKQDRLLIDPGFGQGNFTKNVRENYYLLAHLHQFHDLSLPILVGWSRKSMIGDVLGGVPATERLYGSIAAAVLAAEKGAAVIRVHDVKATQDALTIWQYYARALRGE